MVTMPKTVKGGVYLCVVNNAPGENQFSFVETDHSSTPTTDTYSFSVSLDKATRQTFIPQAIVRNTVTTFTNIEEVNTQESLDDSVPAVSDTVKAIRPTTMSDSFKHLILLGLL